MSISHGDKLFVYYKENIIPKYGRYSYFGTNFGSVDGFSQYIHGYILAAESIYEKYISCEENRSDILDTIIYPLCFNYRQIVELYIKYLYFKYSKVNGSEKINFVNKVSHKLKIAWNKTKPSLQPQLAKINNPIDLTIFDDFIKQIDTFDSDSFRMRYPIKKDLSSVHAGPAKLDVVGLHRKMMGLFNLFCRLDTEIDNVLINNTCNEGFADIISSLYCKSKTDILIVIEKLRALANKENEQCRQIDCTTDSVIDMCDIVLSPDKDEEEFENIVIGLPNRHAAMLALLIHVGKDIVDRRCKLAFDQVERNKDFMKLIEMALVERAEFISLDGKFSNREMCYALIEKSAKVTLKWIEESLSIINSCIISS